MPKLTLKTFTEKTNIDPKLVRAVVNQLGGWEAFKESAPDIANHGIGGGFHGFIYHSDTMPFARKHKALILELAKERAADFGENSAYTMISHFGCFKDDPELTADRLAEIINGRFKAGDGDYTTIFNALAWYAGESVAVAYNDVVGQR